jgi:hypothetical protein
MLSTAHAQRRRAAWCPVAIDLNRDQDADLRWLGLVKMSMAALVPLIVSHFATVSVTRGCAVLA